MKLQLPFFPEGTKLINETLGFREQDGTVYYLHNGVPIFKHSNYDWESFRFILANLIVNKLCKLHELSKATGIISENIQFFARMFQEKGAAYFFVRKVRKGQYTKMTPDKMSAIQKDLNDGKSLSQTALNNAISVSTISCHIKLGNLKRKIIKGKSN